ncbi:MAG: nuclear transport factor 2 family protein [Porticoccaceae bacterium]|nr:nuclear transport factor 2 family protein [Porticoccaceae bacterium]
MSQRNYVVVPESDRAAILDLISAYTRFFDDMAMDEMAQLFTQDVRILPNLGPALPEVIEGRGAVRDFYTAARQQTADSGLQPRHFSTNPLFSESSATAARLSINMLYSEFDQASRATAVKLAGRYSFAVKKVDGEWFIEEVSIGYDL